MYLVCIPVRMFMQEALQYWAPIINIAQGSLPKRLIPLTQVALHIVS